MCRLVTMGKVGIVLNYYYMQVRLFRSSTFHDEMQNMLFNTDIP